jgi:hypothetical protein
LLATAVQTSVRHNIKVNKTKKKTKENQTKTKKQKNIQKNKKTTMFEQTLTEHNMICSGSFPGIGFIGF